MKPLEAAGKTIEELRIGQRASLVHEITAEAVRAFAEATGDFNPLHLDEAYASGTLFRGRIAHGMMVASMLSNVIGTQMPGAGSVYLSQALYFRKPVRIGDRITAEVVIEAVDHDKGRVSLQTTCWNQDGKAVLEGEAVVSPKPKKSMSKESW